jgi:hypothetical protein
MKAKQSVYELLAYHTEADEEGKVRMEIRNISGRKSYDDLYMIKIDPPRSRRIFLKKPYPSGMKLIKRDGQDYIKWRPELDHIGVHDITVVFEGEETSEQKITIYVFNKELLKARQEGKSEPD